MWDRVERYNGYCSGQDSTKERASLGRTATVRKRERKKSEMRGSTGIIVISWISAIIMIMAGILIHEPLKGLFIAVAFGFMSGFGFILRVIEE